MKVHHSLSSAGIAWVLALAFSPAIAAAITTFDVGDNPVDVAFQPNGAIALVANRGSGTVSVVEVASHTVITTVTVDTAPEGVAFSPDGKRGYVANDLGRSVTILE
jgi:YVTN family beta-propeller protein